MKPLRRTDRNIAVLQLSRIGDILMSLPLLEALSKKYEGAEIYFFVNGMFDRLLPDSPFFKWIPVHFNRIHESLTSIETVEAAIEQIEDHLGRYFGIFFEQVFNLSSQRISAVLAALLDARERHGIVLSKDGTLVHTNPNLSLFSEIKTGRNIHWIHQVEIYLSSVRDAKPVPLPVTCAYLFGDRFSEWVEAPILTEKYILLSPGASVSEKKMDSSLIEAVCRAVSTHTDYPILLIGTEKEASWYQMMQPAASSRIIDYTGKTENFRDLWNLIFHAECIVCNDSGPMHMAALLNKKTIVFEAGSAFFPETVAYNDQVLFFKPVTDCYPCPWIGHRCEKDFSCKEAFDVPAIADRVLSHIENGSKDTSIIIRGEYKTIIDETGLSFHPEGKAPLSIIELLGIAYQCFWKEKLFGFDARALSSDISARYRIRHTDLQEAFSHWKRLFEEFDGFIEQLLSLFPLRMSTPDPDALDRIGRGIDTIAALSDQVTFLTPLLQFHKIQYHSVIADTAEKILAEYHRITGLLKKDCQRIYELMSLFNPEMDCRKPAAHSEAPHVVPAVCNRLSPQLTDDENPPDGGAFLLIYNPNGVVDKDIFLSAKNSRFRIGTHQIEPSKTPEGHTVEKIDIARICRDMMSLKPDFLLTINGAGLDNEGLLAYFCASMGIPIVLWFVDEPFLIPEWGQKFFPQTTMAFVFDRFYENRLKSWGIPWVDTLPLGTNYERMMAGADSARQSPELSHALSFAGALEYEKIQYLLKNIFSRWTSMPASMVEVLKRAIEHYRLNPINDTEVIVRRCAEQMGACFEFPDSVVKQMVCSFIDREASFRLRHEMVEGLKSLGIAVYGEPFWEKLVGSPLYHGRIDYYSDQISLLYASSRINLNISKYQLKTTVNQRVFDCPAANGFLLTDYREDIEEYFQIDQSAAVYFDLEDLKKKIAFYLDHEKQAKKIVENAKALIQANHTYHRRLQAISRKVRQVRKESRFRSNIQSVVDGKPPEKFSRLSKALLLDRQDFRKAAPEGFASRIG